MTELRMTDEQYLDTQKKIIAIGAHVRALNLTGFLDRVSTAETFGPFVDPTRYRMAIARIEGLKELARAFLAVKIAHEKLAEVVISDWVSGRVPMPAPKQEPNTCVDPNCPDLNPHPEHL